MIYEETLQAIQEYQAALRLLSRDNCLMNRAAFWRAEEKMLEAIRKEA